MIRIQQAIMSSALEGIGRYILPLDAHSFVSFTLVFGPIRCSTP